jgi:hypothetical protein
MWFHDSQNGTANDEGNGHEVSLLGDTMLPFQGSFSHGL